MKKLIIALTAIVAMASCKKESITIAPTPEPTPIVAVNKNMVKSVRVFDNGTPQTEDFNYDAQGKIVTLKNDNRTSFFNFVSASSLVVTEKNNADNSLYRTYESTLNDKGYVTKIVIKNAAGIFVYSYDFTYNAEGNIINQKSTYPNGSTIEEIYVIVDGNPISSKLYYDNVLSNSREYVYDATKVDKTKLSFTGYWSIPGLFGKSPKNLRLEFKDFNPSGTLTWHSKMSYDIDADGYPVKQTTDFILQGKLGVTTFSYQ
jgi:hypothetical protein